MEKGLIQAEPLRKFCSGLFEKTGAGRDNAFVNADKDWEVPFFLLLKDTQYRELPLRESPGVAE
jgi:hypothetical protein